MYHYADWYRTRNRWQTTAIAMSGSGAKVKDTGEMEASLGLIVSYLSQEGHNSSGSSIFRIIRYIYVKKEKKKSKREFFVLFNNNIYVRTSACA